MTRAAACAASVARTSGLLARRTGRRHAARGLPEVRRRGRLRAVGGTGQPVHQCVLASWRPLCERCFSAV